MRLLRRFLNANSRLSSRFDRRHDAALYARYDADVASAVRSLTAGATVVDVGGGRRCSFAHQLAANNDVRVIAVDISPTELAANTTVDETRVANVVEHLPFEDGKIDLLVSRTLLEHVESVEAAARNMARVLRPGAQTLHLLPCRYALFAIAARVFRFSFAKQLLHMLIPATRGVVEFDVFYDHGHPDELERIFRKAGFREVRTECTWDQADYFHPVFPVFLLVLLYQRLVEALAIRRLSSYVIIRAVR